MKPAPKFVLPGHIKYKVGMEPPSYALSVDNLEISLTTIVDKAHGNASGSVVESFIKPRPSKCFGYP